MHTNDLQLTKEDIGQLENVDQLIHFFARLGYDADNAIPLNHAALGMDTEELHQQILRLHRIASDPDETLIIYFFEVRSVTIALTQAIARRFRERTEEALLIFTKEYESFDFVLLDREIVKGKTLGKSLKQIIRPRSLTIDRRNPDPIAMRVLKRFTFTEADGSYQWDKLRAAYEVAEWAEPEFNNRALFSDYYLKYRLTDARLTSVWGEDARPIGRKLHQFLSHARQRFTQQPEQTVRADLYEPLFRELGFEFVSHKPDTSNAEEPDYKLYTPGNREKPVALALTYVWNRNLDDEDPIRDPDTTSEIPGALVVSVLEKADAPWVIMTNGKLWRLYSATTSNKATNYYEIDLEEALDAPDRETTLKYWWLLFRHQAFTGFLDNLLQQSADYAKALGERLKDRVFTQIFPHFAAGFIEYIRAESGNPKANFDDDALQMVYEGTLTFLYRLMFVLYAESLELLPLYETHGYRQLSLYTMKQEIKTRAGDIVDEAPNRLKKAYTTSSTALYERLNQLFTLIDTGDYERNLPTYNGGLFSQTSEDGEFLADYAIPDYYLALGLDRLCRDVDDKTQALAFIDYKSLGVRQLGSIYEGLLEFKLRIAQEQLTVIKEKGKEIYIPVAATSLSRSGRGGRGKDTAATILEKGDVYLENDKKERKATGSYYTPDYIVKYIVENTVGPVLERKFEELRPRLREAQKQYRQHKDKVAARGHDQSPELFWNGETMRQLADECLNMRVLDPAMGSGHFLVEVVDFVSNRLIDFLNGWSDNPVWAMLNRTREDILGDMERQRVTIDANKLTRVALLKRAVLKRCVYGVDLNEMAVELAKVSLWLDAFTLGAPLSFLDHHLKQGNSLIGARVQEVREALQAKTGEQMSLLAQSKFTGMMLATDLMRQVSYLSDNTVGQVSESQQAYRDARDHLAPYKRVLDVYTSRWFGNEPHKKGFDPAIEFLKRNDTQAWIENPETAKLPHKDYMNAAQVAAIAEKAAEEKRFFHWELEFPEVFFVPGTPRGQDVQLKKDGGFDAVVGNPPYGRYGLLSDQEKNIIKGRKLAFGSVDIAEAFMSFVPQITISNHVGMIVPKVFTYVTNWFGIREELRLSGVSFIADVSQAFLDVLYEQVIYGTGYTKNVKIGQANGERIIEIHDAKLSSLTSEFFPIYLNENNEIVFDIVQQRAVHLGKVFSYWYGKGGAVPKIISTPTPYKIVQGRDIARYTEHDNDSMYLPERDLSTTEIEASKKRKIIIQDIVAHVTKPIPHIILMATLDDEERLPLNTVTCISEKDDSRYSLKYCLAVVNSYFCSWYVYHFIYNCAIRTMHFMPGYIDRTPIPQIDFITPTDERELLVQDIISIYNLGDSVEVAHQAQMTLNAGKSDVVHDVLAHLAQRMIDLNKEKQTEVKRFLGWLESKLKIAPKSGAGGIDSLKGKTIVQGYLGDYQKDEPETKWGDFYDPLHQNRNRFGVKLAEVATQIQQAYEKSLAVLRPIKQQLAATDALIDQIVYKLYGLTDEEIELIERPAYEQTLADAKTKVLGNKKLQAEPEATAEAIAQTVLPAAKRLQSRIPQQAERARLDKDLPGWQQLPGDVPTFLLTGDYNIATQPDHLDFSTSVIAYAKAVEVSLYSRLFLAFRAHGGYGAADCHNNFLQAFMRGEKHLTLGSFPIILGSSKEVALRQFAATQFANAGQTLFSTVGVLGLLQDAANIELRNKAAHDEVLTREDAQNGRKWALAILQYL